MLVNNRAMLANHGHTQTLSGSIKLGPQYGGDTLARSSQDMHLTFSVKLGTLVL